MLDYGVPGLVPPAGEAEVFAPLHAGRTVESARPLRIGLLNNMPDAALAATERQFQRLIGSEVVLELFALDGLPRGAAARAHVERSYAPHTALAQAGLDALVITGCEPRAGRLDAEPYFPAFADVVDWATTNTVSTLFSCLAAHAGVLHLDRIERRPLPAKHWGVFACSSATSHPLLAGMPRRVPVPHSRWNDLAEVDLAAHGYTVLRRSPQVGVDLFVREGASLLVFLQGHPEYDADSLAREYRRDMSRFLEGTRETCPPLPRDYYSKASARCLDAFAALAQMDRDPALIGALPALAAAPTRPCTWQEPAAQLFRNWLAQVALRRLPSRARLQKA